MENNKNAMYAQAGRSRGWTQGVPNGAPVRAPGPFIPATPEVPAVPVIPAAPAVPVMPAPPVVVLPEPEMPKNDCQTLVMAYIAMQKWQELYEPEQGLARGTMFAELDLPFVGEGACKHE